MADTVLQRIFKGSGTALLVRGIIAISRARRRSGWQLAGGIVSVLAGITALLRPGITALSLALVIGAWAVVLGASQIARAFDVKKSVPPWWVWLVTGVLTILFGFFVLFVPGLGILSLLGLLSAYAIITGVLLNTSGLELGKLEPKATWSVTGGGHPAH